MNGLPGFWDREKYAYINCLGLAVITPICISPTSIQLANVDYSLRERRTCLLHRSTGVAYLSTPLRLRERLQQVHRQGTSYRRITPTGLKGHRLGTCFGKVLLSVPACLRLLRR